MSAPWQWVVQVLLLDLGAWQPDDDSAAAEQLIHEVNARRKHIDPQPRTQWHDVDGVGWSWLLCVSLEGTVVWLEPGEHLVLAMAAGTGSWWAMTGPEVTRLRAVEVAA